MGAGGAETVHSKIEFCRIELGSRSIKNFLILEYAAYQARHGPKENPENPRFP
jgi:hypothetical protein